MTFSYSIPWWLLQLICPVYFRWRVCHPERVPTTGPVILAANHASFLDPLFIGAALPRQFNYLARESLFRFPVVGAVLRSWTAIPVDRDGGGAAGLRAILDRLLAGEAIVLFPEGTRTRDGQLQKVRSGIGLAVLKSAVPVVPVRIFGSFEAFGRHRRFPRPHRIVLKFGPPLLFEALRTEAKSCSKTRLKQIYQEVADQIMAAIATLQPHADKTTFP